MEPVLHLSIPVRDVEEAVRFYAGVLGCRVGRHRPGWTDVWFFGMQVTLQHAPGEVGPPGVRHFGVTLDRDDFDALVPRVDEWLVPVTTDFPGTPREQTKGKLADPSGNVIEVKTYADPAAAFRD